LTERFLTKGVEVKMSRVKVILVAIMPALFLLVSADCFGDSTTRWGCNNFRCLFSADRNGKHKLPLADNSFAQAVHHLVRRTNVQPRTNGFAAPVALAQTPTLQLEQPGLSLGLPDINWELAQSWQFLWRTALEPRAPSLVS